MEKQSSYSSLTSGPSDTFKKRNSRCEYCGQPLDDPVYISLNRHEKGTEGPILLTCGNCSPPGAYLIEIDNFIANPVEWLARLIEKNWLGTDANMGFNRIAQRINEFI